MHKIYVGYMQQALSLSALGVKVKVPAASLTGYNFCSRFYFLLLLRLVRRKKKSKFLYFTGGIAFFRQGLFFVNFKSAGMLV